MIISRTPFRISLFGGGTDYPAWYLQHGGAVLGMAIDKYCYISVRRLPPFFEHRHRLVYSRMENVKEISEIQHPSARAVLQELKVRVGLEIHHDADLPARSGLGSSSSFTVGLLNALSAMEGRMVSAGALAREAIRIEQEVIGEKVGSQDQVWAAHGGIRHVTFHQDGTIDVQPVLLSPPRRAALEAHLMLFFTGFSRIAETVAATKIANIPNRESQLLAMRAMVDEGLAILTDERREVGELGTLLHEGWRLKKELSDAVSTGPIDQIYDAAVAAGALGGKLLGAGGGGFMVFVARPFTHAAIRAALKDLIEVQVGVGAPGSRIVVYEPDGLEHR